MRDLDTVTRARAIICKQLIREGLSEQQTILLMGILTALVWACGGESSTIDRLLSGEDIAVGQTMLVPDLSVLDRN